MARQRTVEYLKCDASPAYFINTYGTLYDAIAGDWIPFKLWPAQLETTRGIHIHRLSVILKARQEGLTWLCLAYAMWLMLFRAMATILLFSRRDDEAVHMLDDRLKGMYSRLPRWLQCREVVESNAHEWVLSNGSVARAFPTTAGDSYTASFALVDEADLIPDLNALMRAVKPTIDAGGQMILLSRSDKSKPESEFKQIYRAAKQGLTEWHAIFLPWHARPDRDGDWYELQKQDIQTRTGALDDLHEQYPATDIEALSPRVLDKRISPLWLQQCYREAPPLELPHRAPSIPGLVIYQSRYTGYKYYIGIDPAEGNPTSDDSALTIIRLDNGEEVAKLRGKFEPAQLAAHADALGQYYNNASLMVERNNHGHAVLLWLRDNSRLVIMRGHDGRPGWLSSTKGKALLYDAAADAFRHSETILHSFDTFTQLSSIEGATLRAPEGLMDDLADSYALALAAANGFYTRGQLVVGKNLMAGYRG